MKKQVFSKRTVKGARIFMGDSFSGLFDKQSEGEVGGAYHGCRHALCWDTFALTRAIPSNYKFRSRDRNSDGVDFCAPIAWRPRIYIFFHFSRCDYTTGRFRRHSDVWGVRGPLFRLKDVRIFKLNMCHHF